MFRIDNSTAVTSQPAPSSAGTPGFFTDGSPAGGVPATVVPAEWLNGVQEELISVLTAAGITPSKTVFNQISAAIPVLAPGRLVKTTIITTSGAFTAQTSTKLIRVRGCGGGGAGGSTPSVGSTNIGVCSGGGSGGFFEGWWSAGFSTPVAVAIGAAGPVNSNSSGGNGGTTTFGTLASAPGGAGGNVVVGAAATTTFFASQGGAGLTATITGAIAGFVSGGQPSPVGLASGGVPLSSPGAMGPYGTSGNATAAGNGGAATGHGAGGAGAAAATSGAAALGGVGTSGMIIVEEFA